MLSARKTNCALLAAITMLAASMVAIYIAHHANFTLSGDVYYRGKPVQFWRSRIKEIIANGGNGKDLVAEVGLRGAEPMLMKCADDRDFIVRRAAILLLGMERTSTQIRQVQTRMLDDTDSWVRQVAIEDLGRQRFAASAALPKLRAIAADEADQLSLDASHAIWSINPDAAMEQEGWRRFASKEFGFSILVPGELQSREQTGKGLHGEAKYHVFQVECDPEIYSIVVTDIVPEVQREIAAGDAWFEMMDEKFAEVSQGTIVSSRQIEHHGYKGHERVCRIEGKDEGSLIEISDRIFIVGTKGYSFNITYPVDSVQFNPIAATCFFESLELPTFEPLTD